MSRQALGRGLRALIPETDDGASTLENVPLDRIEPNRYQPRRAFDEAALEELAQSIRQHGVLEPVMLAPVGDGRYQLVMGERRWRAAQRAGLDRIPAVIRSVSDRDLMQLALIENLQREDLNPIEEAEAYQRLVDEFGLTQGEIANVVGKSRPGIANALRLLGLGGRLREWVAERRLSPGHAKVLLGIEDEHARERLGRSCVDEGWSVRKLEERVAQVDTAEAPRRRGRDGTIAKDPILGEVEDRLQRVLGTKVELRTQSKQPGRGKIVIEYFSSEDLERVLSVLGVQEE